MRIEPGHHVNRGRDPASVPALAVCNGVHGQDLIRRTWMGYESEPWVLFNLQVAHLAVLEDGCHTVVFESLLIPELNGLRGLVLLGHVHHATASHASHTAGE